MDHAPSASTTSPIPVLPGPEGVIVTVERTAICGSDLHLYHDAPTGAGIRLGHEAIGTVADAGPQVRTLKPGDRVLVSGVIGCGVCRPCLAGQPNVCLNDKTAAFGTVPDLPGGQAEAMAVPFADLFALRIPEGIADEEAVLLTDILPTGYLGAQRADIRPGATVVVVGLGPVGIMALQCAALFGPARILAVDMVPERLARAERLGAEPIDARTAPGSAQVLEATGGRGAESVIEAVGADASHRGRAVLRGQPGAPCRSSASTSPWACPPHGPGPVEEPHGARGLRAHSRDLARPRPVGAVGPSRRWPTPSPTGWRWQEASKAYELFDSRADGVLKVLLTPNP